MAERPVKLVFDGDEAKGTVELTREGYGATLVVDGVEVAFVDLFPPTEGDLPQLLIPGGPGDAPLVKIIVGDDLTVIVHKDAQQVSDDHPRAIHHRGDHVFVSEPEI